MKLGDFTFEKIHWVMGRLPFIRLKANLLDKIKFDEELLFGKLKVKISPYIDDLYSDNSPTVLDQQGIVVLKPGVLISAIHAKGLKDEVEQILNQNHENKFNSSEFNYYTLRDKPGVNVVFRDTDEDFGMLDVFNVQRGLSKAATQKLDNLVNRLQNELLKHSKINYSFKGWSAYVSHGVTRTRGPHIDNFQGSLKAFLYLTDCEILNLGLTSLYRKPVRYLERQHC